MLNLNMLWASKPCFVPRNKSYWRFVTKNFIGTKIESITKNCLTKRFEYWHYNMPQTLLYSGRNGYSVFTLFHEIAPPIVLNAQHDVDFTSFELPVKSESTYPTMWRSPLLLNVNIKLICWRYLIRFLVAFTYSNPGFDWNLSKYNHCIRKLGLIIDLGIHWTSYGRCIRNLFHWFFFNLIHRILWLRELYPFTIGISSGGQLCILIF